MAFFNYTENITTIQELLVYNNEITFGTFGWLIWAAFSLIATIFLLPFGTSRAFLVGSFLSFGAAALMAGLGLLPNFAVIITIVLVISSLFLAHYERKT